MIVEMMIEKKVAIVVMMMIEMKVAIRWDDCWDNC
jgi:hypothetical protein